jgi:hypothetical protein
MNFNEIEIETVPSNTLEATVIPVVDTPILNLSISESVRESQQLENSNRCQYGYNSNLLSHPPYPPDNPSCHALVPSPCDESIINAPTCAEGECPSEKPIKIVEDSSSLNRSDLIELLANHAALDRNTTRQLQLVQQKPQYFPQRFRDPEAYFAQSGILLCSHWVSSERYAHCCRRNHKNRSGTCKLHQFCPYCSYLKGQALLREFLPSFEKTNWHHVTLGYDGEIAFQRQNHGAQHYWEAGIAALKTVLEQKLIRGYYATMELKVNSFGPTYVLPHVHAIVDSDQINEGMLEEMLATMGTHTGLELPPNIRSDTINNDYGFSKRLRYLFKPIDLVAAYCRGWRRIEEQMRAAAPAYNSQVSDFVGLYQSFTYRRKKMSYAGSMNSQFSGYIGTPESERDGYEEYIRAVQNQAPAYAPDGTTQAF